jgi:hypothetical protein
MDISDLACGKAGEYLVCADLILGGFIAFPGEQGLCFDVVVEVGQRLAKVQVKTTRSLRSIPQRSKHHPGYLFHVKRMGKNGAKRYATGEVDIFALVALDSREIGYLAAVDVKQTMIFRSPLLEGQYLDERHGDRMLKIKALREQGMSFRQIGKDVGVHPSYACRICTGAQEVARDHRYLRDFPFVEAAKTAGFYADTNKETRG